MCEGTSDCISFLSSEIRTVLNFAGKNLPCYQIDLSHRNNEYPLIQTTRAQSVKKCLFCYCLGFLVFFAKIYIKFNTYFAYLCTMTLHDNCRNH